jgi:hypothetical protein
VDAHSRHAHGTGRLCAAEHRRAAEKVSRARRKSWRCPSASDESFSLTGDDPYNGTLSPNQFKPNYNYLAGKEWFGQAKNLTAFTAQYKFASGRRETWPA